jgi:hypothetical protein
MFYSNTIHVHPVLSASKTLHISQQSGKLIRKSAASEWAFPKTQK